MRWLLPLIVLVAACSKKGAAPVRLDQVLKGLTSSGLKIDALASTAPTKFSASRCVLGPLEGLEALLCEYGSPDAMAAGRKAAEAWNGQADTGVVLDNGYTTLGLADRGRKDPNGKLINKIVEAYQKVR